MQGKREKILWSLCISLHMKKVQIFAHLCNTHLTSRVSEQTWLRLKQTTNKQLFLGKKYTKNRNHVFDKGIDKKDSFNV